MIRDDGLREMLKERLGFQFRSLAQHRQGLLPDRFQRILARPLGVRHLALFHDFVLPQILARRVAGHPCLHCTHADGSSLVALENEPGELGSFDHNPKQHAPPRPASISTPNHPGKPPHQGSVLIVVRGQL